MAECGSITDAAERLFISQPSLSAAIHNLEKEMGVTAFVRSNKGVAVTREGEELLSFARMLLEQADIMQEHFGAGRRRDPRFCVSCQHYSFAVNAFVDVVQQYDADRYSFILRETQTGEIIDDVSSGRSELGLLYLCESNESVLSKLLRKNELVFEELFTAEPHVFISRDHPLAARARITLDELQQFCLQLIAFCLELVHLRFYFCIFLLADCQAAYHISECGANRAYECRRSAATRNRSLRSQYFYKFITWYG